VLAWIGIENVVTRFLAWKASVERQLRTIEQEMKDTARCISILLSKSKDDELIQAQIKSIKTREAMLDLARTTLVKALGTA
jgi:hypothetical protein